jgi:phage replication O-like protein O
MASPQKANGYTPVAHEILDQICLYKFNGAQFRIIIKVWRLTYGFNRKDHEFSITYLQSQTGLSDRTIKKEVASLIEAKVLLITRKETSSLPRKLAFNKNYEKWTIPKSGDSVDEQIDLFAQLGVNDTSPQEADGGEVHFPSEVNNTSPLDRVWRGSIVPPYKEKDLLKKSFKENMVRFEFFYLAYPRKVAKAYAKQTWIKLSKKAEFDPNIVISNTINFAETCTLLETAANFIPHPSTFLNQARYADYETVDPEGLATGKETKIDSNLDFLRGQIGGDGDQSRTSGLTLGEGFGSFPEQGSESEE